MKILIIHNYYREPGGEDECAHSEAKLLEENGHQVLRFSRHNASVSAGAGLAAQSLWSRESYASLQRLIRREKPDVAHFHNVFHVISPSGYWAAASEGAAVVQTLHNYRLVCCNGLLFREGRICEDCIGRRAPWPGVLHSCYRNSRGASLSVVTTTSFHRAIGTWHDRVGVYVAPSDFLRSKIVAGGFPEGKIVVKPNFVHPSPTIGAGDGGFALFAGRLAPEKGLGTLLEAWMRLGVEIPLRVVGDGPLAGFVAQAAQRKAIEWLGRRTPEEVHDLMGRAVCVIVPSEWYENFPRVVVESFAKGTPVVASDVGALVSLVQDGVTGFRFRARDPVDLVRAARCVFDSTNRSAMRQRARLEFESKYSGQVNHDILMAIYTRAITARNGKSESDGVVGRTTAERAGDA